MHKGTPDQATESKKNSIVKMQKFQYTLTYDEAFEAFYLLTFRRTKRTRILAEIMLTVIAVIMLILYALKPIRIHYLYLTVIAILLLFYLLYYPYAKARKGAKSVVAAKGTYQVGVSSDGKLHFGKKAVPLKGDKYARAIETKNSFIVRPNQETTVCIPKRILSKSNEDFIREQLIQNIRFTQQD